MRIMNSPKVSVIIPVYGVEKYIERCARSLFEQTLEDIEYIFVDDCTPDNSISILRKVLSEYPNREKQVKILHHEKNKGLAQARQTGLKIASGEYIAHCDSDDWVDKYLYKIAHNKAKSESLDVVVYEGERTNGQNGVKISSACCHSIDKCLTSMMHRKMWWSLCNKIIKREIYNNNIIYPQDNMGEDMCLTLQLISYCKNVGYINKKYYYYDNSSSIMAEVGAEKQKAKYEQLNRNISKVRELFLYRKLLGTYQKGINYLSYNASYILWNVLDDKECRNMWMNNIRNSAIYVILDNDSLIKERIKAAYFLFSFFKVKIFRNAIK